VRLAPLFLTDRVQKDGDEYDCSLHKLYPERGHVQEVEAVSQHADGQNPLPEHRVGQNKVHDGEDNHRRDDRDRYTEQCATAKKSQNCQAAQTRFGHSRALAMFGERQQANKDEIFSLACVKLKSIRLTPTNRRKMRQQ
jgi:hypothetical protein